MPEPTLFEDPPPPPRPEQRFPRRSPDPYTASLAELRAMPATLSNYLTVITRLEHAEGQIAALLRSRSTVRPTDPGTSADAADRIRKREGALTSFRAGTHRHRILGAYSARIALTDHEAATRAGLAGPGVCYWKRCSELRQAGYVETIGETRKDADSGAQRDLCRITPAGIAYFRRLGPVPQGPGDPSR